MQHNLLQKLDSLSPHCSLAFGRLRQISVASVLKSLGIRMCHCGAACPTSQLSHSGIPPDMVFVNLEEAICPGKASVLTTICPGTRRHPSQIWITKQTCSSHWPSGTMQYGRCCPARFACEAGAAGSSACYCLTLLERPFPWTSDRDHAILPLEDSFNWPGTGLPRHPVSFP